MRWHRQKAAVKKTLARKAAMLQTVRAGAQRRGAGRGGRAGSRGKDSGGPVDQAVEQACTGPAALIPSGSRVLAACSGGADSVALAAALRDLALRRPRLRLEVAIGHVDHALRPESEREAESVRALAARLEVPFLLERLPDLRAAIARLGLEAAAREARYEALLRLAQAAGARLVATAHTRSDQAETLLLRLARGAGPGALSGVRRSRPLGALRVVRPFLLEVGRADTEAYCVRSGLPFVRDPHNLDPRRARARVRAELPRLAALLNPRLEEALAGTAALAADEDELLSLLAAEETARARRGGGLSAADLLRLHPALLRRCLLAAAAEASVRPERQHLEQLLALLGKGAGSADVPGGRAILEGGVLRFLGGEAVPAPAKAPPEVAVPGPGNYEWGPAILEVEPPRAGLESEGAIAIDAARAPFPWTLRGPRPGDRFRQGGGRTRKLADLLAEARVARSRRPLVPVLADASGALFYVEGLRPGDPARGELAFPLSVRLRRRTRELERSGPALSVVQRAGAPRASMLPHRPDEERR
jgi:tRNA(Ile)-lysidine synthase